MLDGLLNFTRSAGTDDRCGHFGSAQNPGNGELRHGHLISFRDWTQGVVYKFQVKIKQRLQELRIAAAVVVPGKFGNAFACDFAREQSFLHRAVGHHADVLLGAKRKELRFDVPHQHAVGRLYRCDRMDRLDSFDLGDVEITDSGIPDLARSDDIRDGVQGFLDFLLWLGPVHLVQVNHPDSEPGQTGVHFREDGFFSEGWKQFSVRTPGTAAFGGDEGFVRPAFESLSDDRLAMAESVGGGGVNPVDAQIEGAMDGFDGEGVVLGPPAEGPAAAADRPGAEADLSEIKFRPTERFGVNGSLKMACSKSMGQLQTSKPDHYTDFPIEFLTGFPVEINSFEPAGSRDDSSHGVHCNRSRHLRGPVS